VKISSLSRRRLAGAPAIRKCTAVPRVLGTGRWVPFDTLDSIGLPAPLRRLLIAPAVEAA